MLARSRAALPPLDGELRIRGLREPVRILRDRWGVPHLRARNTHDLYFAQGFVVASDRLFQIDYSMRLGAGRLAEVFGDLALPMDRFVRTVGWNRAARRLLEQWDDLSWEMAGAFTDGIAGWIDRMPGRPVEYDLLQADPLVPEGVAGAELMAAASVFISWSLSANWDGELLRAEVAERLGWDAAATLFPELPPEPAPVLAAKRGGSNGRRATLDLLREGPRFPRGQGSNAWVVSGARSATGAPLLANDPHLVAQVPSAWYEIHLSAPGIDVRGVCLPFAPGVIVGFNDRVAWGITGLSGDTQDLYLEHLDGERAAALYGGLWEPVRVHREEIGVRGRAEPEIVEVLETRHGPILDSYLVGVAAPEVVQGGITETYALRWVGLEDVVKPSNIHRLDTAADFEEFRAALSDWGAPGLSVLYADVEGNIGYQAVGLHPIRRTGDGTVPVPGFTDDYEWEGYVPFEEMPWAYNPEDGFLVAANNKVHQDSYTHLLGKDFLPPFRARRIAELLTGRATHDVESFARIQQDTVSLPAKDIVPRLLEVEPEDERQKHALELLEHWDFDLAADSAAAALYEVWCQRIADVVLRPRLGEELFRHYHGQRQWSMTFHHQVLPVLLAYPAARWFGEDGLEARDGVLREALDLALDELGRTMGEDPAAWEWGRIHRVRLVGRLGAAFGLQDPFGCGDAPWGGDEQTVQQGAFEPAVSYEVVVLPSWRQIVDLANPDGSLGILPTGQAANPASAHFRDLFPLWASGRYHPLQLSEDAVDSERVSALLLRPE